MSTDTLESLAREWAISSGRVTDHAREWLQSFIDGENKSVTLVMASVQSPELRKRIISFIENAREHAAVFGPDHKRSAKADVFLADIIAVYCKHELALSHEDCHGAFLVVALDKQHVEWLRAAFDETRKDGK